MAWLSMGWGLDDMFVYLVVCTYLIFMPFSFGLGEPLIVVGDGGHPSRGSEDELPDSDLPFASKSSNAKHLRQLIFPPFKSLRCAVHERDRGVRLPTERAFPRG